MTQAIIERQKELASFHNALIGQIESAAEMAISTLYVPIQSHDEAWLLHSSLVAKIVIPEKITAVPGAPQHIVGIINVSGVIFTLVDFNALLGRSPVPRNSRSRAVCLESTSPVNVALYVDRVLDFLTESAVCRTDDSTHPLCEQVWTIGQTSYRVAKSDLAAIIPKA